MKHFTFWTKLLAIPALVSIMFFAVSNPVNAQYCTPSLICNGPPPPPGQPSSDYPIHDFVTTGAISNINHTASGCSSGSYGDFTGSYTLEVDQGSPFNIDVKSDGNNMGFTIWIDWNQDNDFNDPNEKVWNSGSTGTQFNGTVNVPSTASPDTTRMRVMGKSTGVPTNPCDNSGDFGETHDYKLVVTSNSLTVNPVASNDTVCSGDSVTLSAQASGGSGNYTYSWSSNPAGFSSTKANPAAMVSNTTTFIVNVDDGTNTATDSVPVFASKPDINLGPDTFINIFDHKSITLSVDSGYADYTWSTGDTTHSVTVDTSTHGLGSYDIWVTAQDSLGCMATDSITVTFLMNSIHEHTNKGKIQIYPNPNKGIFKLKIRRIPDRKVILYIYNFEGRKIICEKIEREFENVYTETFDLSTQPQGVYLIKLIGDHTQKMKQMIIQ